MQQDQPDEGQGDGHVENHDDDCEDLHVDTRTLGVPKQNTSFGDRRRTEEPERGAESVGRNDAKSLALD